MNEDCCLPDIVARINGYIGDPLLASSLFWLIGRVGRETKEVGAIELGRAMGVSHPTGRKILIALQRIGFVAIEVHERLRERTRESKFKAHGITVCYNEIFKKTRLETLRERLREDSGEKYSDKSPCDVASVLPITRPTEFTDSDLAVGRSWLGWAMSVMPWKQAPKSWSSETFAKHLRKIREKTGLNDTGIAALLEFIKADDFWSRNALSPAGLLAQSANGNRKIDNILLRMKPKENKTTTALRQWASAESSIVEGVPF